MSEIRNVYCIGRNYRLHALELGNEVPDKPMVFTKPTHAVVPMDGRVIPLPADQGEVHHELELVVRIGQRYELGMTQPERCIDAIAFGLDLTLRDVQSKLKAKGHPWLEAKGFLNSAPLGDWLPYEGADSLLKQEFTLLRNGIEAQRGNVKDMLFSIEQLIIFIGERFGLDAGDIIYTGTPAGVAALADGDKLEAYWGKQQVGCCVVKLV